MLRFPSRIFLAALGILMVHACVLYAQQSATPDQLAQQGAQALQAGRLEEAEAAFVQLSKLEPGVAEIDATLGAVYFQDGKLDSAIAVLRHALRLKPSLVKAKVLLAICLSETGKTAEALPGLESGFQGSAEPEARRMCGLELLRGYSALHRDADAVATALALNKLFPDDPEILYQTGRIYGNFAYLTLQKLQDKAPDSVWTIQSAAEANESKKAYEAAITDYKHVLVMEPNRPGVHYRLGRVYLARYEDLRKPEDRDAAAREFVAELGVDPGNANARYELANIQVGLGNFEEARLEFERALQRFPDFEEALVGLSGVYLDTGKAAMAVAPLEQATRLRPDDEVAWYRLARAEHAAGNKEGQQKALAAYRRIHNSASGAAQKPNSSEGVTPQTIGADANP